MEKIKQDLSIGKNIQRIRKSRKMSQKDVTIQMNLRGRMISVSGYAHIEQGRQICMSVISSCSRKFLAYLTKHFSKDYCQIRSKPA